VPFAVRLVLAWAVDALALALVAWIFSGVSVGGSAGTLLLAAVVFGLLSAFMKPVLKVLTFPLALVTLGAAWYGVAMFVLWLTSAIVGGFVVSGFWTLVGATFVVWAVGSAVDRVLFPRKSRHRGWTVAAKRVRRELAP
jgi:putative membrane protein